jgi:predicted esterase
MTGWFDITTLDDRGAEDKPGFEQSKARIDAMIQGEIQAGIPPERIVLGGFSQGGAVTLYTLLRSPVKIGGAVVLSGWLPLRSELPDAVTETGRQVGYGGACCW